MLTQKDWWFQHDRGCDKAPPLHGEYLELPAGRNFTVEIAGNRAATTLGPNPNFNGYFGGRQELYEAVKDVSSILIYTLKINTQLQEQLLLSHITIVLTKSHRKIWSSSLSDTIHPGKD